LGRDRLIWRLGIALGSVNAMYFSANAFLPGRDTRWYRTGDIVVELPDGNYKFLGRRDRMIKTLGYRVAPDEIADVLPQLAHLAVLDRVFLDWPAEVEDGWAQVHAGTFVTGEVVELPVRGHAPRLAAFY